MQCDVNEGKRGRAAVLAGSHGLESPWFGVLEVLNAALFGEHILRTPRTGLLP